MFEDMDVADVVDEVHTQDITPEQTPHGMGCATWPLRPALIAHLAVSGTMKTAADQFDARWDGIIGPSQQDLATADNLGPPEPTCEQMFGPGVCILDLDEDVQVRIAGLKSDCSLLARL